MRKAVEALCARLGVDPLLVQGAGGNVSWKTEDTLWVKASGTWLMEAGGKDIFVPVDLVHLRAAIKARDFEVIPRLASTSALRPSIETLLHALMPHAVVVHLHAVDILAHLVRASFPANLKPHLDALVRWAAVNYHKPGPLLARAVNAAIAGEDGVDVVLLQNHGVVIGGKDVGELERRLGSLTHALQIEPRPAVEAARPGAPENYEWAADEGIQQLAIDPEIFARLEQDWALYPDHVVFLGIRPHRYSTMAEFTGAWRDGGEAPQLVFIKGSGVLTRSDSSPAMLAQLRCYYDVMSRQASSEPLNSLRPDQVAELLDWDAEKYRVQMSKQ